MSYQLGPVEDVVPHQGAVVVKEVRAYVIGDKVMEEKAGGGADCHAQASGHWFCSIKLCYTRMFFFLGLSIRLLPIPCRDTPNTKCFMIKFFMLSLFHL